MTWTTLRIQVATPLFNTDGHQNQAGIRVPSLRGAMRFWFRALAGTITGNNHQLLADLERAVFGGTDHSSPVKLRIPEPPTADQVTPLPVDDHIFYLLGLGLARDRQLNRAYVPTETRLPNGPKIPQTFDLQARFTGSPEAAALALAALWLTCAYGGLGARVRRGFGALRIIAADGELPPPWTEQTLQTPGPDFYEHLTRLTATGPLTDYPTWLAGLPTAPPGLLDRPAPAADDLPAYPVLGRHTLASLHPTAGNWPAVLSLAGKEWRHFRASETVPAGSGGRFRIRTPEAKTTIDGTSNHFPLGALGLPVGYGKDTGVNAYHAGEELRRASPLWLRPVGTGSQMRLFSFAFLGELLPATPDRPVVRLKKPGHDRELIIHQDDLAERATQWIETMRQGETFVRKTT